MGGRGIGREEGREGDREGGREIGREEGREGDREGGRGIGREGGSWMVGRGKIVPVQ